MKKYILILITIIAYSQDTTKSVYIGKIVSIERLAVGNAYGEKFFTAIKTDRKINIVIYEMPIIQEGWSLFHTYNREDKKHWLYIKELNRSFIIFER